MFEATKAQALEGLLLDIRDNNVDPLIESILIKLNSLPFAFTKFSCQGHPEIKEIMNLASVCGSSRYRSAFALICEAHIIFGLNPRQKEANEFLRELVNFLRNFRIEGEGECFIEIFGDPIAETSIVDFYNRVQGVDLRYTLRLTKGKKFFDPKHYGRDVRFWILRFSALGRIMSEEEKSEKIDLVQRNLQKFYQELEVLIDPFWALSAQDYLMIPE